MSRLTRRVGGVLAATLVLGVGAAFVWTVAGSNEWPTPGAGGMHEQLYSFESVEQMAATSDLVVEATVESVEAGRVVGEGTLQLRSVTLLIDDVMLGKTSSDRLILEEEGWTAEGEDFVPVDSPAFQQGPSVPGEHAVFFLVRKGDSPEGSDFYRLINSQALYLIKGDGLVGAPLPTKTGATADSMSIDQMRSVLAQIESQPASEQESPASPQF